MNNWNWIRIVEFRRLNNQKLNTFANNVNERGAFVLSGLGNHFNLKAGRQVETTARTVLNRRQTEFPICRSSTSLEFQTNSITINKIFI